MKNKRNNILLPFAFLLLTACGSQKTVIEPPLDGPTMILTFNADNHMKSLVANRLSVENVTAKVRVRVAMGDRSISTTGTLRMRRNDVIQISLVDPLVGIAEVGRMEFTPTNVLNISTCPTRKSPSFNVPTSISIRSRAFSGTKSLSRERVHLLPTISNSHTSKQPC